MLNRRPVPFLPCCPPSFAPSPCRSPRTQYDLIAILNQNAHHFDRSQPPEAQSDDAREKLHQLADFVRVLPFLCARA